MSVGLVERTQACAAPGCRAYATHGEGVDFARGIDGQWWCYGHAPEHLKYAARSFAAYIAARRTQAIKPKDFQGQGSLF